MASVMAVSNETKSTSTRITKEGRKLTYKLSVMQQPERARACGSGAKSSADRRPVDPPPVVELRIFEGDAMNEVTFSYNANFFLFATLENARPIAHGRVAQTAPSFPILTGMPVSGMAYLDRPSPAGYFIFPDLSVRHEGKYRLAFTLYEEVKEDKDADAEPATRHPGHPANHAISVPMAPKAYVDWRLEVKSQPFTVYSAKKFPGLAESTALSRIVAEQGCRVRIRRDVRMRRREKVAGYDEQDGGYMRIRATPTPDPYHHATPIHSGHTTSIDGRQHRSPSVGSVGSRASYGMDMHRGSMLDQSQYGPPHYPPYASAPTVGPVSTASYTTILSFGAAPTAQYPSSAYAASQSASGMNHPSQKPPPYAPPQMNYFAQGPPTHSYTPPLQGAPLHHLRQGSGDLPVSSRRGSMSYTQPPAYTIPPSAPSHGYSYSESSFGRPPQPVQQVQHQAPSSSYQPYHGTPTPSNIPRVATPMTTNHALPPLPFSVAMPIEPKREVVSSFVMVRPPNGWNTSLPLQSAAVEAAGPEEYAHTATSTAERPPKGKRAFGSVFSTAPLDQSYRNGTRPSEEHTGLDAPQSTFDEDEFDGAYELNQMKMQYKRADGTEISRRLPALL